MNSLYRKIIHDSRWSPIADKIVADKDAAWLPWLLHTGSLTEALIDFSENDFRVSVLSERWIRPLPRETRLLGIDNHLAARVREVELLCYGNVVVFARSIIPLSLFKKEPNTFQGMGSKPLGHLLFQDGRARTGKRAVSRLEVEGKGSIYGRATPYQYHGGEILVSEFFINPVLIA